MATIDELTRRLPDLLVSPRETLDLELKGWLDIANNIQHKAIVAKAVVALANHGGGYIIIGMEEAAEGAAEAPGRPGNLGGYITDNINAIVERYVDPSFHCDIGIFTSPDNGSDYPIVTIPGGHSVPIRSRRAGPNEEGIQQNVYYTRLPGPRSEPPQSANDWDRLIRRCISNAREDLMDQFRRIMAGGAAEEAPPTELEQATAWLDSSRARWEELANQLDDDHPARIPHGRYMVSYQLFDDALNAPNGGAALLASLRNGVVRLTGWPPFWVPDRQEIAPYMQDGNIECFIGRGAVDADARHADFWRVSPAGQFFLVRGYQEDSNVNEVARPGEIFDLTLPSWRMAEILSHAASMAVQFGAPAAQIAFVARWEGLADRRLSNWANPNRLLHDGRVAHQDSFQIAIYIRADQIAESLPEFVDNLIRRLYELFDFFELPATLVTEELARMREGRF